MKTRPCECGVLESLQICDEETQTTSHDIEVIENTDTILPTDQILVIRKHNDQTKIYSATFDELNSEVALSIIQNATQAMPRTDPADGCSLWLDDGFIRIASGDASRLGTMPPTAFEKSLREAFKILPTSDPGDGGPWLCGGMLMRGSTSKNED
ncbi:hypothetical protein [Commensalibacter oyaizuii]|uniref:Uncharacterized protein n=1 Tax=Commensalibacter oyaizuii TaxID=3043873 RepID=A0ABT6Q3J8_9PROT|nr:hypothetical protein [Commensalibacter sp. TBRC 16381]MDI2091464.1 hypothetical protein [Commensalibacter sp. TBRC 16381]MDI2091700.1 hypothetical protein [Commensalibacter sp. TBRC 16381]